MKRFMIATILVVLMGSMAGIAQVDPSIEQGVHAFGSYDASQVDSVNSQNGGLAVNIPLFSYPERGKFGAAVGLLMSSKQWAVQLECTDDTDFCTGTWEIQQTTPSNALARYPNEVGMGVAIDDGVPDLRIDNHLRQLPNGHWTSNGASTYAAVSVDGSTHPLMGDSQYSFATIDGSGIIRSGSGISAVINRNGVSKQSGLIPNVKDTNGNIEQSSTGQDSMGRDDVYTAFANAQTTSNSDGCSGPLAIADIRIVMFPGPNGLNRQLKLCSAGVSADTAFGATLNDPGTSGDLYPVLEGHYGANLVQTAILYDGVSWTNSPAWKFEYDPDYLEVTKITFPTGGTISYTWETETINDSCALSNMSRFIHVRTANANDGSPAQVSTYTYNLGNTVVADVQGNTVTHYFDLAIPSTDACNLYETKTVWHDISSDDVKTVETKYGIAMQDPFFPEEPPHLDVNVLPTQITTTLPNGYVSKVENAYDSSLVVTYLDPYRPILDTTGGIIGYGDYLTVGGLSRGLVTEKREYAYGSPSPGSLVRCTDYTYKALDSGSPYLTANILDLPKVVSVYNGACTGTPVSETTYGYDETFEGTGIQPSGLGSANQLDTTIAGVRGNLTSVASGGITTHTRYYDTGKPYQTIDGKGYRTTYTYSPTYWGAYLTQTNMPNTGTVAHMTSGTYDYNTGLVASTVDQNIKSTFYHYDSLARMQSATYPDSGLTTFTYPDLNTVVKSVSSGTTTTTTFDGLGRVSNTILTDTPANDTVHYTYDSQGNLANVSNPYRTISDQTYGVTHYTYDVLKRKRLQTEPDSNSESWDYTGNAGSGETTSFTDEVGNVWKRTTDALGRLIQVDEPNSVKTYYTYNVLDDLTNVDQGAPLGSPGDVLARSFGYDSLGRLTSATNPEYGSSTALAGTVGYSYDNNSNVHTKTDARGITTTYVYDELNRLTSKTYSDATYPVAYTYDTSSGPSTMNTIGRLTDEKTTAALGSPMTERAIDQYDAMGRIKSERQCFVGGCSVKSYTLTHDYSPTGNLIASNNGMSNTYAKSFGYTYDGADRLQTVTSSWDDPTHPATLFQAKDFDPIGLLHADYAIPTGTTTAGFTQAFGRDNRARLTGETDSTTTATPTTLYAYALTYYANSNIHTLTDSLMGRWSYIYDSLNRLTQGSSDIGTYSNLTLDWTYDNYGNRISQLASGMYSATVPQPAPVAFTGGKNRVYGWAYDLAGNVTNDGTNMYQYDAEGHQTANMSSLTGLTGYVYDAEGRRVMKVMVTGLGGHNPTTTVQNQYLLGLDGEQVTVLDGSNNWQWTNVYANGKVLATYSVTGGTQFLLTDQVGTKRFQIRVTAPSTVTVSEQCLSLPYGDGLDCTGADSNQLHFTGKERDSESGNDYFGARYYSSNVTGRFMSPDWTETPDPTPYADLKNPQTLNLYTYELNNPLSTFDQDGHRPVKSCSPDIWDPKTQTLTAGRCTMMDDGSADPGDIGLSWIVGAEIGEAAAPLFRLATPLVSTTSDFLGELFGISANGTIKITADGLEHVLERHVAGGAKTAGKSLFKESEGEVRSLINKAASTKPITQANGNLERVVDAGRIIGKDRATGAPTSTYTVITKSSGDLVTAFPGRP